MTASPSAIPWDGNREGPWGQKWHDTLARGPESMTHVRQGGRANVIHKGMSSPAVSRPLVLSILVHSCWGYHWTPQWVLSPLPPLQLLQTHTLGHPYTPVWAYGPLQ